MASNFGMISPASASHIATAQCKQRTIPFRHSCKYSLSSAYPTVPTILSKHQHSASCKACRTVQVRKARAQSSAGSSYNRQEGQQQSAGLGHQPYRRDLLTQLIALHLSTAALACQPASCAIVDEESAVGVFAKAQGSTVAIVNYKFGGGSETLEGVGTGVVWDQHGHVVTNYHCVAKTEKTGSQVTRVAVTDDKGVTELYDTKLIGMDTQRDLAVLQLEGTPLLQPILLGTSSGLQVGQSVFAIGNPYGLSKTMSAGVVSGLNRSIPSPVGTRIYGVIQTDASINGGNSGGPLLDSSGRLVGLNTATFTRSGTGRGSGVNFALPADMLREVVPKLIVYGNAMGKRV